MTRRRRAAALLGLLLVAGALSVYGVGYLLSRPFPERIGDPPADLFAQPVTFESASRSTIHGWYARGAAGAGCVLLLPGVRANRLSSVSRAHLLHGAGYSVLLIDLQATGESPGRRITFGWLERLDVLAAVDFLRRVAPGEPVAVVGTSVGGASALLATPPLHVEAMVIESVYPTIEEATRNRLRNYLGPVGMVVEPLLLAQMPGKLGVEPSALRPIDHIAAVRCPILLISGAKDRATTIAETQALYERARPPKALWIVPGAAHVDLYRASPKEYERRVLAFLAAALRRPLAQPLQDQLVHTAKGT